MDVPARRVPCVLGTRHVAVSKGAGARRSTKDSRKGSLPVPRNNAAQRGSAKRAPHKARDHAAPLIRIWQHPKRSGTTAPFSATAEMNCPTSRENSPAKPTPRPVTGGRERKRVGTGPGGPPRWYGQPLYLASTFRALVS